MPQPLEERTIMIPSERSNKWSEDFNRQIFDFSPIGMYIIQNGWFKRVNYKFCELTGYSFDELIDTVSLDIVIPEDRKTVRRNAVMMLKGKRSIFYEYRSRNKNGDIRWVMEQVLPIQYLQERAVLGFYSDITKMKQTQERLKESEEKYRRIFESINSTILLTTVEGKILELNRACWELFGYTREELLNLDVHEIWVDPSQRLPIAERIFKTGSITNYEIQFKRKDGTILDCLVTSNLRQDENGKILGFHAVITDITERKRMEQALVDSMEKLRNLSLHTENAREKELKHIAREIHDELGQLLTALKMDLIWLENKLPPEQPRLNQKVASMLDIINMTIKTVQRVSRELRPGMLDDLGLVAAMEWQLGEFQSRTGIDCRAQMDIEDDHIGADIATTIFRIFQETLTNIARHAEATHTEVILEDLDGCVKMTVADNGRGITPEQVKDPSSIGLIGMRERAHFCNGVVHFNGEPDKGTTVEVKMPIHSGSEQ